MHCGCFESIETDPRSFHSRKERLFEAFGSDDGVARHAKRLGTTLDRYLLGLEDVRLVGEPPEWGQAFYKIHELLCKSEGVADQVIVGWMRDHVEARWPEGLPNGPEVLNGPLAVLGNLVGMALFSRLYYERMLGVREMSWERRFEQCPVLAFIIGQSVSNWRRNLLFVLRAAARDRSALADRFFGGKDPGKLLTIELSLGDPHAGGQSVSILRFSRGGVVFKSKDLRMAWAMGRVARLFTNTRLVATEVLLREHYGWENLVEDNSISGHQDADDFYLSLGGWLGVLHYLGATDFWFDNLIADGATPRFLDFETLIQPTTPWPKGVARLTPEAERRYQFELRGGATGILPFVVPIGEGKDPCDLSCLSQPGEHSLPFSHPSDPDKAMTWSCEVFAPRLPNGKHADITNHFKSFELGYTNALDELSSSCVRDRTVEIFRKIEDAPVRIILIDTWTCYRIIRESLLPSALSDGVWREISLHRCMNRYPLVEGKMREAAVRDLRQLDIPLFVTHPNSRDIWGTGGEREKNMFPASALESIQQNASFFCSEDKQRNLQVLRTFFSQRSSLPPRQKTNASCASEAKSDDLLEWAEEIGGEVCGYAVRNVDGYPNWISLSHDIFSGNQFLGPMAFDVLSGRTGLASVLFNLGNRLDRSDWITLGTETLAGAAHEYVHHSESNLAREAGHAVGIGGLILALSKCADLRELALQVFNVANDRSVWMNSGSDYVSGLKGWNEAVLAIGKTPMNEHGQHRPYAPSALSRLAQWLDPASAAPICQNRSVAAIMRKNWEEHGAWLPDRWIAQRHDLSGIDGIPALANAFVNLADTQITEL